MCDVMPHACCLCDYPASPSPLHPKYPLRWSVTLPNLPNPPHPPGFTDFNLSLHSDMASVAKAMASPESGLEVRDRMWLKITIPNAFLGEGVATASGEWGGNR